jgi:hypothetical protein
MEIVEIAHFISKPMPRGRVGYFQSNRLPVR